MIGAAMVTAVAIAVLAHRLVWVGRRIRTPRPLESTRVQTYRVGARGRFIGIVTGDLRRVRCAEVWVNSENTAMQMARYDEFSVSSIIRYEGARRDGAGRVVDDRIAGELDGALAGRQHVPAGTAVVTGSGELRRRGVRYVVHVAAVQGEPGAGFRQVREVGRCVTNALAEVDRLPDRPPVQTILFPLLGTGQGGGDLQPTVEALLGAAADYFTSVPQTKVTTTFFLAYTDVELAACEAACKALGLPPVARAIPRPVPVPSADTDSSRIESGPMFAGTKLRLGFAFDVVEFGRRMAPEREAVQRRLFTVARRVLLAAGLELDRVNHQWAGDGLAVVLPSDIDPPRVLSSLLRSTHRCLVEDNRTNQDRIRLRMAAGVGLVGIGATGFAGSLIVDVNRLLDGEPLRAAVRDHPESDLLVLISDHLYAHVVRPGYLRKSMIGGCQRVDVAVKEFHETAWLWVAPGAVED